MNEQKDFRDTSFGLLFLYEIIDCMCKKIPVRNGGGRSVAFLGIVGPGVEIICGALV